LCDVSLDARNAKNIFGGSLVVGDHDTITLYGIHPQNSLKDYSRRVTALLLKDTAELDMAIADVLSEIEHFELRAKKPAKMLLHSAFDAITFVSSTFFVSEALTVLTVLGLVEDFLVVFLDFVLAILPP